MRRSGVRLLWPAPIHPEGPVHPDRPFCFPAGATAGTIFPMPDTAAANTASGVTLPNPLTWSASPAHGPSVHPTSPGVRGGHSNPPDKRTQHADRTLRPRDRIPAGYRSVQIHDVAGHAAPPPGRAGRIPLHLPRPAGTPAGCTGTGNRAATRPPVRPALPARGTRLSARTALHQVRLRRLPVAVSLPAPLHPCFDTRRRTGDRGTRPAGPCHGLRSLRPGHRQRTVFPARPDAGRAGRRPAPADGQDRPAAGFRPRTCAALPPADLGFRPAAEVFTHLAGRSPADPAPGSAAIHHRNLERMPGTEIRPDAGGHHGT